MFLDSMMKMIRPVFIYVYLFSLYAAKPTFLQPFKKRGTNILDKTRDYR